MFIKRLADRGRFPDGGWRSSVLVIILFAAAVLRFLPHPPNFAPIAAIALFGGAYLRSRWTAFGAPLVVLLLSDLLLGFHANMPFVYASFGLIVVLGLNLRMGRNSMSVLGSAVAASVMFFLITNFGYWLSTGVYARTWSGLAACYMAAVPFFQYTLMGDLFYCAVLFGGFELASKWLPAIRQRSAAIW